MRDRTFGIEFEIRDTVGDDSIEAALALSAHHPVKNLVRLAREAEADYVYDVDSDYSAPCVDPYAKSDGQSWDLKYDSSCGFEICTPAMHQADWPEIGAVLAALYQRGCRTSTDCSAHVHIDIRDFTEPELRKLVRLWRTLEPAIFQCLAASRRDNMFCRRVQTERVDDQGPEFRQSIMRRGRYLCLNLTSWWEHGRVEIRAHHGTLRTRDIRLWVDFLLVLVDAAQRMSDDDLDQLIAERANHPDNELLTVVFRQFVEAYGSLEMYDDLYRLAERRMGVAA